MFLSFASKDKFQVISEPPGDGVQRRRDPEPGGGSGLFRPSDPEPHASGHPGPVCSAEGGVPGRLWHGHQHVSVVICEGGVKMSAAASFNDAFNDVFQAGSCI